MAHQFVISIDVCVFLWHSMAVGPGGKDSPVNTFYSGTVARRSNSNPP